MTMSQKDSTTKDRLRICGSGSDGGVLMPGVVSSTIVSVLTDGTAAAGEAMLEGWCDGLRDAP